MISPVQSAPINKCLLCGSPTGLKHKNHPGYQAPDTFQIFHCDHCNTSFASPRVEASSIYETIYKLSDKIPGYERYHRYARDIKNHSNPLEYLAQTEEAYWGVKESLKQLVRDKASTTILEIGSGLGYLTFALNQANYNVLGLDISPTAVNQAINNFGDHYLCTNLFDYALTHPATFDIVILTEVIEHVENPLAFFAAIHQLLKPGGHAIITTPNKSFYFKEIIWSTDLPPVHFWWFSEDSMIQLAKKTGLNIRFINFSSYYKINYSAIDMKVLHDRPLPKPIFNQQGELIVQEKPMPRHFKSQLRSVLFKIPFTKKVFRKLKAALNQNLVVCAQRGTVLCAVLQKPLESSY